jgi:hypothetical protein
MNLPRRKRQQTTVPFFARKNTITHKRKLRTRIALKHFRPSGALGHNLQAKGLSPVCVRSCSAKRKRLDVLSPPRVLGDTRYIIATFAAITFHFLHSPTWL